MLPLTGQILPLLFSSQPQLRHGARFVLPIQENIYRAREDRVISQPETTQVYIKDKAN